MDMENTMGLKRCSDAYSVAFCSSEWDERDGNALGRILFRRSMYMSVPTRRSKKEKRNLPKVGWRIILGVMKKARRGV